MIARSTVALMLMAVGLSAGSVLAQSSTPAKPSTAPTTTPKPGFRPIKDPIIDLDRLAKGTRPGAIVPGSTPPKPVMPAPAPVAAAAPAPAEVRPIEPVPAPTPAPVESKPAEPLTPAPSPAPAVTPAPAAVPAPTPQPPMTSEPAPAAATPAPTPTETARLVEPMPAPVPLPTFEPAPAPTPAPEPVVPTPAPVVETKPIEPAPTPTAAVTAAPTEPAPAPAEVKAAPLVTPQPDPVPLVIPEATPAPMLPKEPADPVKSLRAQMRVEPVSVRITACAGNEGQVQGRIIDGGTAREWTNLGSGLEGDGVIEVRTGAGGEVQLVVDEKATVIIGPTSRAMIKKQTLTSEAGEASRIFVDLQRGRATVVPVAPGTMVNVTTPTELVVVREKTLVRLDPVSGATRVHSPGLASVPELPAK